MRILHIMAGNGNGGAEVYSTDVMLALHEKSVDQCVVMRETAPRFNELKAAGIRMNGDVLRTPFRPWQRHKMKQLIAKEKPDIIHCWMRRAASLVSKDAGKIRPLIGWFGNYEVIKHYAHCTDYVGVTKDIIAHTIREGAHLGIGPERATYIPTFPSIVDAPALDRATLNTPKDAKVLLTLSRLHPKKGLDTLMHATKDFNDCYLWLAGDGPMFKELEALAYKLGISDRVRFLGWRTDRGALLKAADVCVLPSNYEPFGTVILEAWYAKVPFVACESAGPAAHIVNEQNGMMVPINDAPALGTAIRRVLDDKALQEHMTTLGYEQYMASFTKEAVTQQWLLHYEHILKKFKQTRRTNKHKAA